MAQADKWSLPESEREGTRTRLANSILALAGAKGTKLSEDQALEEARAIERKAHTVAQVESRTTTGRRPDAETTQEYARKAGQLVTEAVERLVAGGASETATSSVEGVLDLTGDREFVTAETATELFKPVLDAGSDGAGFTRFKLSTKSFGLEAAEVAKAAILKCSATLRDLDLSDSIAGRPEDEALQVLQCMCSAVTGLELTSMDLSDNALGEKGVRACKEALVSQKGIEALAFKNVGCSPEACEAIAELVQCKASLKKLHLYNNMSDNRGAQAIARLLTECPKLEDFMMVSSRVKEEGGQALVNALEGKSMRSLNLSDNFLGPETGAMLAAPLASMAHLITLNLSETSLEDEGVIAIAQALEGAAPNLEVLELAANEITGEGCQDLCEALAKKDKLRVLNLKENELGDKGAVCVAHMVKSKSKLEVLDLYQNEICRAGARLVVSSVLGLKHLKAFDLNANYIPADCVEEITKVLKTAFEGLTLDFDENEEDMGDEDDADWEEEALAQGVKPYDPDFDAVVAALGRGGI